MTTNFNKDIKKVGSRRKIFSNWSNFPAKRGLSTRPVPPSPYVSRELTSSVRGKYWRDLPIRRDMQKRFDAFVEPRPVGFDRQCLDLAFERLTNFVYEATPKGSLAPATFSQVWKNIQGGSSSGYPNYVKKGECRETCFRDFSRSFASFEKTWDVPVYPCTIAARSVVRPRPENKPRLVWSYPIEQTVREGIFMAPLLAEKWEFMGWAFRWLDNGSGYERWIKTLHSGETIFMLDFESFDSRVPAFMIRKIFSLIETLFRPLTKGEHNIFKNIVEYFIHTPIIWYDGVVSKHRGIPSGSWFTQVVGSLVNVWTQFYIAFRTGRPEKLRRLNVLGDDSICSWVEVYPDYFMKDIRTYCSELGMSIHPVKSKCVTYSCGEEIVVEYLGMQLTNYFPHFVVDYDAVMTRLLYPEKRDRCPEDCAVRTIGLAWSYPDKNVWCALATQWNHLVDNFGLKKLDSHVTWDPEVKRWFDYVFRYYNLDMSVFPDWFDIRYRYYGYH